MNPGTATTEQASNLDNITADDVVMGGESNENQNGELPGSTENTSSSEEETSGEGGEQGGSGDSPNPDDNDAPEGGASGAPATSTDDAGQPGDEDDLTEEEAFTALSEETGVQVSSDEDIVTSLSELASLRKGGTSTDHSDLSPAIREAIELEKAGVNLAEHFARTGMDFDKMDGTDVLRQQYFKTEAKLYSTNQKFAQMKFERSFNEKYGKWLEYDRITNQEDKETFAEEHGMENIDYEKMMFETDTKLAREEMTDWQKTAAPAESASPETGMTPEEEQTYSNEYKTKVSKSWEGFEALSVQMGEGLQDFSLGLNEKTKPIVEGWIDYPVTFLQDIGFDGNNIDTDTLLPIMTAIAELSMGTFGSRIAGHVVNSENIETFKKQIEKPKPTGSGVVAPSGATVTDDWDKIGEAAEKAREDHEQGTRGR